MAVIDTGTSTAGKANVDANFNLNVVPPTTLTQTGFVALAGRNDDGVTVGTPRVQRLYATESGQGLKTSSPMLLWDDTFNATTQNTSKYTVTFTTETITAAGGFLNLWAAGAAAVNINSGIQTFKTFPLCGKSELRATFSLQLSIAHQTNNLVEFGLFSAVLSTRVAPTDGVFFRYNASNELRGVINFNGTETQTAAITQPSAGVTHDYTIVTTTDLAVFYIDGVAKASLTLSTDAPSQGQPFIMGAQPLTMRTYTSSGGAPAAIETVKISDVFITLVGPDMGGRAWSDTKAGFGHMAYQGQNGHTQGTTANTLNGATPAASALTNTAISTGSPVGLGGLAHVLPTLAVGTDGLLFSYQNPVPSVTITPRNLIIKGVTLSGGVDLVLTGGPLVLAFSLAYGHTAVSLATAESASFASATTKAPRRVWLGVLSCIAAAVAGTALTGGPLTVKFDAPITVAPGEFVAITVRNQGVVTTLGSIIIACPFDAHFE